MTNIGLVIGLSILFCVLFCILWNNRDGSEWYSRLYHSVYRIIDQRRGNWPGK